MPITERTLRKWRKEALQMDKEICNESTIKSIISPTQEDIITLCERILRMSSELLDHHLLRRV